MIEVLLGAGRRAHLWEGMRLLPRLMKSTLLSGNSIPDKGEPVSMQENLAAYEVFFQHHHSAVFGYLWRMTGEEQTANDLTQETFLRAWRQFTNISTYEQPRAWLFHVATHLALNYIRMSARRTKIQHVDALEYASPDVASALDHTEQVANQDLISRILLSLPMRERAALVLHAVYGFSCAEITKALHISPAAAKIALWRGRERFRREYLREGDDA